MPIKAEITRDSEGYAAFVKLVDGTKKLEVLFDKDIGFTIEGHKRSFTTEMLRALQLIYPTQAKVEFTIPEPLQVQNVAGGRTVLFDDMEGLDKWTVIAGAGGQDNALAYNGSNSLQVNGQLYRNFPSLKKNFDLSVYYYLLGAIFTETQLMLQIGEGALGRLFVLSHVEAGQIWRVETTGAVWQQIGVHTLAEGCWHIIGLSVRDWIYRKVRIDNIIHEVNIPAQEYAIAGGALGSTVTFITNLANNFDDLLIQEVEY